MKKIMKERCVSMMQEELKRRQKALSDNRVKITQLAREQITLKKEWREINDFMWELQRPKQKETKT